MLGVIPRAVDVVDSEKTAQSDRRIRPRVSVAIELKLHVPEHHYMLMSRTIDLSAGGAFVRTNRPLPIGVSVTVAFNRGSDRNPLQLEAEVVRAGTTDGGRQEGVAVRFCGITDIDVSLLNDLIDRTRL